MKKHSIILLATFILFIYPLNKILAQNNSPKNNPVPLAACSGMGAESGWGAWTAKEGYHKLGGPTFSPFFFSGSTLPTAPRFNLTSGAGVDSCTVGLAGPIIPYVCPFSGFGSSSIQLGQPNTNGIHGGCTNTGAYPGPGSSGGVNAAGNGCSERLIYPLTVGLGDTNFLYAYAMVTEHPVGGHTAATAPFCEIFMLDANNDTIPCSYRRYTANDSCFFPASCTGSVNPGAPPNGMIVKYKPWSMDGINLKYYVGQPVKVVITNSDCALGGHYGYSYWDFACGSIEKKACIGTLSTLCGSDDYCSSISYQWYKNRSLIAGATNQCLVIPTALTPDTFSVQTSIYGGIVPPNCPFYVQYILQDTCATTGVNDEINLISDISIFPSPASKNLFVDFNGKNLGKATISICNVIGEKLLEINITAIGKQMLDVSGFSEGIYFVRINTDAGTLTKKIIISH